MDAARQTLVLDENAGNPRRRAADVRQGRGENGLQLRRRRVDPEPSARGNLQSVVADVSHALRLDQPPHVGERTSGNDADEGPPGKPLQETPPRRPQDGPLRGLPDGHKGPVIVEKEKETLRVPEGFEDLTHR
jgi:hypothetical protein